MPATTDGKPFEQIQPLPSPADRRWNHVLQDPTRQPRPYDAGQRNSSHEHRHHLGAMTARVPERQVQNHAREETGFHNAQQKPQRVERACGVCTNMVEAETTPHRIMMEPSQRRAPSFCKRMFAGTSKKKYPMKKIPRRRRTPSRSCRDPAASGAWRSPTLTRSTRRKCSRRTAVVAAVSSPYDTCPVLELRAGRHSLRPLRMPNHFSCS